MARSLQRWHTLNRTHAAGNINTWPATISSETFSSGDPWWGEGRAGRNTGQDGETKQEGNTTHLGNPAGDRGNARGFLDNSKKYNIFDWYSSVLKHFSIVWAAA